MVELTLDNSCFYLCKESSHHTLVSDLPPASPHQELEVLDENGRLSDSGDAEIILDKEMKGPHDAPLDNSDVFNSSLQPSERNTNDFGTVQVYFLVFVLVHDCFL